MGSLPHLWYEDYFEKKRVKVESGNLTTWTMWKWCRHRGAALFPDNHHRYYWAVLTFCLLFTGAATPAETSKCHSDDFSGSSQPTLQQRALSHRALVLDIERNMWSQFFFFCLAEMSVNNFTEQSCNGKMNIVYVSFIQTHTQRHTQLDRFLRTSHVDSCLRAAFREQYNAVACQCLTKKTKASICFRRWNYEARNLCQSVIHISQEPFFPIYFALGRFDAEDPNKCSDELSAI